MTRVYYIFFVFLYYLLNNNVVFAQKTTQEYLEGDTTIVFDNITQYTSNGQYKMLSISYNNKDRFDIVDLEKQRLKNKEIKVYQYDCFLQKKDSSILSMPSLVLSNNYYFDGIHSVGDSIILYMNALMGKKRYIKFLIFDIKENILKNELTFIDALEHINDILTLPNNKLLICHGYLGLNTKANNKFMNLSILNLSTGQVEHSIKMPLSCAGLSYIQKNKQIAITDNSILFAELGIYKVYEYDFNLKLINTIEIEKEWKIFPQKTMKKVLAKYEQPIDRIYLLSQQWDNYHRIFRIYTDDNNNCYIMYKKPNQIYATIDIWKKENNSWSLYKENIEDFIDYDKRKDVRKAINFTAKYLLFKNNKIFTFGYGMPLQLKDLEKMNEEEYYSYEEEYFLEDDGKLLLDIFKNKF